MKKKSVLIYGEYSGYGKSLVKGFRELGYSAEVFSFSGDGFKQLKSGLILHGNNRLTKLLSLITLLPKILKYKNILVMNPGFFNFTWLGPLILLLFKATNKNIILLCCGDDVEFIKRGKSGEVPNWPYIDIPLPKKKYYSRKVDLFINYIVASSANKIVPVMYDYSKAWRLSRFSHKVTETIPLACDGDLQTIPLKNFSNEKIVIMHGINREGFKGTKIIKKALSEIEKKYGDRVQIILPEKLPFAEYLKVMESADIAIDQTKGNSYGMNAIYSMFAGHVVLAPANDMFKRDLSVKNCPIITINNSEDSIYQQLSLLINNYSLINKLKYETQSYALTTHAPKLIAEKISKYLN
ncbi:hypothetical protein [Escherichia coli]|uniref:hypothetical protein n=1 Tax=Escherichia coli TaxID=562 RepID=UPI0014122E9F|nr:hypothetical protein [Escherichia coli]EKN4261932.1 hypothetical protein [Escherichia coli]MCV5947542.1 hypothetical protein [Escherichia coli]MEB7272382.1 hypothetical protein [Escherichia coli]NHX21057.1 hypothetical protein [Escherichia coli]UQX32630.1 hypothetical protein KZO17_12650 [Escherichia coli]